MKRAQPNTAKRLTKNGVARQATGLLIMLSGAAVLAGMIGGAFNFSPQLFVVVLVLILSGALIFGRVGMAIDNFFKNLDRLS